MPGVEICQRMKPQTQSTCKNVTLPKAGSHHTESLFTSNVYIYMESNKPIMVVQIIRSQVSQAEVMSAAASADVVYL